MLRSRRGQTNWSDEDTKKLFKLRQSGMKTDLIALEFPKRKKLHVIQKMVRMGLKIKD
jgi:hypothetical protein